MSTRLSLALLLVAFTGCIDGSTPVNVGVLRGDPDATHSVVEVIPSTGVRADGVEVALVRVTVRDSNDRALQGQAVSFTATGSENTLIQPPVTDASGQAQGTIASTHAETKTLTVRVGSGDKAVELAAHPEVTFVAGNAARLVFITQPPASTRAGDAFTPSVQLRVLDAHDNVVLTPVDVTLALSAASNGATLEGTVTGTTAEGTVSFDDLLVKKAGTGYMLGASGPGLGAAVSSAFDIVAGPADASRTLVSVSKSTVAADGTDSTVITVTVRDAFDNPVSGQPVSVASSGTGNTLTPSSGTTGANGTFTATLTSTTAETKTIQATVATVLASQQPQVTFVPGSASRLAFVTQPPAQAVAGQTLAPALQLQVLDAQGNLVTSANINVTLTVEPVASGATLGGTTTRALASGLVSFDDLNVQKAGTGYTLRATGPGLTSAVSSSFDIVAGPVAPSRTLVQVGKSTVVADGVDSTTITVTTRDAFDNPVSGQSVGLAVSGSGNSLAPVSGSTGSSGTFSATLKSTKAEVKTVSATVNGTAVSSQPQVTFIAGTAVRLSFVVQPPAQTVAGQTMTPAIQVQALDAQGNRATSASINVTLAVEPVASGATLGGTTTKALASGLVDFTDLNVQKAGTGYTLRATATGLTDAVSSSFDILAGPVDLTRTLVQVGKNNVIADGADSTTITVTTRDSFDNPVSGQTVGLAASGSGNSLTPVSGTTASDGTFSATLTSTKAEIKTISATVNGNPVSSQPQVTFVPGPASRLSFVVQPPAQTVAGQTMTPAIQVQALDAQGNRATSASVNVTLAVEPVASGATLGGTTTKALASGLVSFSDLNIQKAGTGYNLRATATGLTDAVSSLFDIVAGPVDLSKTLVQFSKDNVIADGVDSTILTVITRDAFDNPVSGQAVTISVSGSGNSLTPVSGTTGSGGSFNATLKSTKAEIKTISATVNGTTVSLQPQVTFIPGPAVKLAFILQPPAQTVAGRTFTPGVQVEALDAQGNRVTAANLNVTLALEPVASGATLGGTPTRPVASGVASFADLNVQKAGTGYTLRATSPGLTDAVSNPFDIISDAPSLPQTTVTVTKSTVAADGLDFTTIIVTVRDAFGNPVSGQTVGVTVTGSNNTLSSPGGTTGSDGSVSLTLSSTDAEIKTVQATMNSSPVAQQPQVTFVPGPAVALGFVTEPPASISAGQTMAPSVLVQVLDAQGNRVTGSTATISLVLVEVTPSGATLGGTVSRTVAGGVATFDDLFVQQAGLGYTLQASSTGLSDAFSSSFDVNAGTPTQPTSSLAVAPANVVADNVAVATITVTVKDAYGNPVPGEAVSVSASGVNNTFDRTSGVSGMDGKFVAKLRSTAAEVKSVDATASSFSLPTTPVTFVAGAVAVLNLNAVPTQVEANGTDQTTLTATAEDAFGNRVPNVAVSFSAPGTGNVFAPGNGNTDSNGQRITGLSSTSSGAKTVTAIGGGKTGLATVTFLRPAAQVSNPVVSSTVSGCATLQYTLTQVESARADVSIEYEEAGVFKRATQAGASTDSGVSGVATSPAGVTHTFHWNSTADLPTSNATIRMRVTAQVPGALPNSVTVNSVAMANGVHFGSPGLLPAGTSPNLVARAELNDDGKTDLVVGSSTANDLQVLLGDGLGSFSAPTLVTVGVPSSVLLLRDVDGDGKVDVLAGGATNSNIYLLKGTGTGTFGAATVVATLQGRPVGLAVGDFNRDGKLDLVATSSAGTMEVALATGAGVFAAPTVTNVGGSPGAIAVADLNLDSRLDLLFVDPSQDVKALLGTGAGTFGAAVPVGVGPGAVALAVTDLNRDSRPDVVMAHSSSGQVSVARGNGDGTFSLQPAIATGGQPAGLAVTDLDVDGNMDVVVTGVGSDVLVLAGQIDGSLSSTPLVSPAGGPTASVVVLDADRSGHSDVVAARPGGNGVAVLLSLQPDRCESSLNAGLQMVVGTTPAASTVADLDGDGRPDLVVAVGGATAGASALNIAKGRGNGTFSAFTSVSLGTGTLNPQGVATGDFNGDGRLDLVSANQNTNTLSVLLDNGAGGYGTPSTWSTGTSPRAVAVADFDSDGKLDMAVVNSTPSNVTVLYGNGDGTFPVSQSFNVGNSPQALVVGDFNGDGKPDIATANFGGSNLTSLRNNGGRTSTSFTSMGNVPLGYGPRAIAIGDFNGDNKPDLAVVGNPSSVGAVSVVLGAGDGSFGSVNTTAANLSTPEFRDPRGLVVGDIDKDGKLDVLVGNNTDASVILLKGLGTGKFTIGSTTGMGTGLTSLAGGDLDGDGEPDVVGTVNLDSRVAVLRSKGLGLAGTTLSPVQVGTAAASARGIIAADVNKDGKLDLLTANRSTNKVTLLLGDGQGNFSLSTTAPTVGTSPAFMAAGDLDRDGNPDVVVANTSVSASSFSILKGDGSGGLTKIGADLVNPASPRGVVLEDMNGDGWLDLVAGGSAVYLSLNNGAGVLGAPSTTPVGGGSPQGVAVADFNRDGKLDVVSANNSNTTTVSVLLGNGTGGFAAPKTLGLGASGSAIAIGDFDRDGKVDVAVLVNPTSGNYEVRVLRGKGDGTFITPPVATLAYASGALQDWLVAGDVDGDGRLDLVTVLQDVDAVLVWRGDGNGNFAAPVIRGSSDQAQSVGLADLNGDGMSDIFTGGFNLVGVMSGR